MLSASSAESASARKIPVAGSGTAPDADAAVGEHGRRGRRARRRRRRRRHVEARVLALGGRRRERQRRRRERQRRRRRAVVRDARADVGALLRLEARPVVGEGQARPVARVLGRCRVAHAERVGRIAGAGVVVFDGVDRARVAKRARVVGDDAALEIVANGRVVVAKFRRRHRNVRVRRPDRLCHQTVVVQLERQARVARVMARLQRRLRRRAGRGEGSWGLGDGGGGEGGRWGEGGAGGGGGWGKARAVAARVRAAAVRAGVVAARRRRRRRRRGWQQQRRRRGRRRMLEGRGRRGGRQRGGSGCGTVAAVGGGGGGTDGGCIRGAAVNGAPAEGPLESSNGQSAHRSFSDLWITAAPRRRARASRRPEPLGVVTSA